MAGCLEPWTAWWSELSGFQLWFNPKAIMAALHTASRAKLSIVIKTCVHATDTIYDGTDHSSDSANIWHVQSLQTLNNLRAFAACLHLLIACHADSWVLSLLALLVLAGTVWHVKHVLEVKRAKLLQAVCSEILSSCSACRQCMHVNVCKYMHAIAWHIILRSKKGIPLSANVPSLRECVMM